MILAPKLNLARRARVLQAFPLLLAVTAAALLSLTSCKTGTLDGSKNFTQIDYAHGGTVTGVIHFSKPAPPAVEIDMAQDPACAMSSDPNHDAMTSDYVVNHGGLANVLVYIQSGLGNRAYPIPREPTVIDQRGCRFVPHVSGAMVGQGVHFLNSDNTLHNVHMSPTQPGNNAFDVSQNAHADPVTRYFQSPELMMPIRCNNHPWMHSYLNILANPFFTVSDDDGHFTIRGLPPGTYTLTAVHEQLGKKSATITVTANGTVQQAFTY